MSIAKQSGYEYLEVSCTKMMSMGDAEFAEEAQRVREAGLLVEHLNDMLPPIYRLTGPEADFSPVLEYLDRLMERTALLDVKSICFGSGACRNVPDGFSLEEAQEQLTEFLTQAGDKVAPQGIVITVEALRPAESNIIHSVAEALALAFRTHHPQVRVLADWYHMAEQKESPIGMLQVGSWLKHCHIARAAGRAYPGPTDGPDEYAPFFKALKAMDYSLDLSVESSAAPTEESLADAYRRMKEEWENAGTIM